ncbi:MAG: hypothetical protein IQL11_07330, partial [Bacteroidales bacterium]|nr:hypothetical protein [Bacteroidales bacterium]
MSKKWTSAAIILILLAFIGYIIFDVALRKDVTPTSAVTSEAPEPADEWIVTKIFEPGRGPLNAVGVSDDGNILLGGESFIACYDKDLALKWELKAEMPVTAVTASGSNVFAAIQGTILVLDQNGEKTEEWGPFEDNAIITSIAANRDYVAYADAANRTVYVLDNNGAVKYIIGKSEESFVIPSLFFDVDLGNDNILYVANTGKRRIEKRNIDGSILGFYGEPGIEPENFCGCCNPAHFALIPGGFVTAEKGINRIKILDQL